MKEVKLFFAGDFCSKPSTSHIAVSDRLRQMLAGCDLRICNFEVPLMPEQRVANAVFYQHDDAPEFLQSLGFDLFALANNHAFDCGDAGFLKTAAALNGKSFGAGSYDEAYRVKVVEVNGVRLGFLALSYAAKQGVFDDVSAHDGLGCAYINDLRVNHDIMAAKQQVDYLFVLPHDGIEYIDVPLPETRARYRDFIDYGADAVIGTHPHCPQGWETYKGKTIFYSLGNFFFNSKNTTDFHADKPHWYEGICVVCTLSDGGMNFEMVNTRNRDNVGLDIDGDAVRDEHNKLICDYLQDKKKYWDYLIPVVDRLAREQEFPIVERFYAKNSLKSLVKIVLKRTKAFLTGRSAESTEGLLMLAKNDARRSLLIQSLKH
ncbi:MAG: CapA family protein [Bacteroidales bacterium]|nr:CapA family protein [Bacteroidales bacterium]